MLLSGRIPHPGLIEELKQIIASQKATLESVLKQLEELVRRGRVLTGEEIIYFMKSL